MEFEWSWSRQEARGKADLEGRQAAPQDDSQEEKG